ncbi:UNVERIFIED_CONTAM: hypothetical protein H355_006653, partial [Colinus virginianus]
MLLSCPWYPTSPHNGLSHFVPTEVCTKPRWDVKLQFEPDRNIYRVNEELLLTCPERLKPFFSSVKCAKEFLGLSSSHSVYQDVWWGRISTGAWIRIGTAVSCVDGLSHFVPTGECTKPRWGVKLQFEPDRNSYRVNEELLLTCPERLKPFFSSVKCAKEFLGLSSSHPVYQDVWWGRNRKGAWIRIQKTVSCSTHCPTSPPATLTKTPLPLPETCQRPQWGAGLRLVPDLEVYRKNEEVMLSCPPGLQPSYTHVRCAGGTGASDRDGSLSRNMWQGRNSIGAWNPIVGTVQCLVPQKPEQLQLDARTGMITWKALPPCLGEIIEYQLNITVRPLQNGSFLQIERLRLSSQTTEYLLPAYGTSTRYAVAMRGLTAVGPGAASLLEFHTNSSGEVHIPILILIPNTIPIPSSLIPTSNPHPLLHPHPHLTALPYSEHQLLVAVTHNSTVLEDACSGELQPSNGSYPPDPYVAAVLNLSAPTDFMLGDGTQGQGFHNAPLRPGWDYTALLRLVRRSPQAETFTCVCYSFSM